ncbi:unnamed protein product [Paramecium octaurelia]|uniref:Kazal-like domain-containing protein n=1 Tax=Paramecium octaurelia TaxID=43137 RepID=A0A8S1UK30_PAROT|nr:unnamed protein product [Paramecium octaurelia]
MNYLIIVTLILFTAADKITCPLDIDKSVLCPNDNQPVCAFTQDGSQLGSFENPCLACRANNASYYETDECIVTSASLESINPGSGNTSTTNKYQIFKCDTIKSDNIGCPAVYKPTCGLFDSTIQCIQAPCGLTFGNECEACSAKNIDSYFYGKCDEIPSDKPKNPVDDIIINCTEPRPEICTLEYTETCAFISTPCLSESCMKSAGNYCEACSRKEVVGYVKQSCSNYLNKFIEDYDYPEYKDNNKNQEKRFCSTQKPSSCDDVVKEVCATYNCNDTTCLKEYQNECQACLDSTTVSYVSGKCQSQTLSGSGYILGLALFAQIFM